jgi:hypothetical protein
MRGFLGVEDQQSEQIQQEQVGVILSLLAISFTGLTAITVVKATLLPRLGFAIYYLFVSFVLLFLALSLQRYANTAGLKDGARVLTDCGTISLLTGSAAIVLAIPIGQRLAHLLAVFVVLSWAPVEVITLTKMARSLSEWRRVFGR